MDELIREYADILQNIYENDTVGDYTYYGVLTEFARKMEKLVRDTDNA